MTDLADQRGSRESREEGHEEAKPAGIPTRASVILRFCCCAETPPVIPKYGRVDLDGKQLQAGAAIRKGVHARRVRTDREERDALYSSFRRTVVHVWDLGTHQFSWNVMW